MANKKNIVSIILICFCLQVWPQRLVTFDHSVIWKNYAIFADAMTKTMSKSKIEKFLLYPVRLIEIGTDTIGRPLFIKDGSRIISRKSKKKIINYLNKKRIKLREYYAKDQGLSESALDDFLICKYKQGGDIIVGIQIPVKYAKFHYSSKAYRDSIDIYKTLLNDVKVINNMQGSNMEEQWNAFNRKVHNFYIKKNN